MSGKPHSRRATVSPLSRQPQRVHEPADAMLAGPLQAVCTAHAVGPAQAEARTARAPAHQSICNYPGAGRAGGGLLAGPRALSLASRRPSSKFPTSFPSRRTSSTTPGAGAGSGAFAGAPPAASSSPFLPPTGDASRRRFSGRPLGSTSPRSCRRSLRLCPSLSRAPPPRCGLRLRVCRRPRRSSRSSRSRSTALSPSSSLPLRLSLSAPLSASRPPCRSLRPSSSPLPRRGEPACRRSRPSASADRRRRASQPPSSSARAPPPPPLPFAAPFAACRPLVAAPAAPLLPAATKATATRSPAAPGASTTGAASRPWKSVVAVGSLLGSQGGRSTPG